MCLYKSESNEDFKSTQSLYGEGDLCMMVRLMPMLVNVPDFTLIPSDDEGDTDASCTNIRRPFDSDAEYLFFELGRKKFNASPFFSPNNKLHNKKELQLCHCVFLFYFLLHDSSEIFNCPFFLQLPLQL